MEYNNLMINYEFKHKINNLADETKTHAPPLGRKQVVHKNPDHCHAK